MTDRQSPRPRAGSARLLRTACAISALVLAAAAPGAVFAQGAASAPTVADGADAHYEQGRAAYAAGRFDQAYDLYTRAYAIRKSYEIAADLGQAAHKLGKLAEAAEHLHYSLAIFPTTGNPERRARQQQLFDDIRKGVAQLKIEASVTGVSVAVDQRDRGTLPLGRAVFVDPGSHVVRGTLSEHEPAEQTIVVKGGETRSVELVLKPRDNGGSRGNDLEGKSLPLLVSGGVLTASGLVVGATLLGLGLKAGSDRDDEQTALGGTSPCGTGTVHTAECGEIADLADRYKSFTVGGIIALSLGAAFGVATLTYAVVPSGGAQQKASAAAVWIVPVLSTTDVGAGIGGTF